MLNEAGFWFEKPSAADAGLKAFLTTRVGDVGFLIGILTLFAVAGTLNFADLDHVAETYGHARWLPIAALFIFCGTIGKSAQFPLHVWLPDAMEGPTPVSALIHAATMVAAGVYLVARSFALFEIYPQVMALVTLIGTLTAFMAAFIALTATDIKKVLAYSTISQLGYMVAALGLGGLSAGTFHLMTHAFFKALLFLGAGSVIHGTGTQDIRELGGLFGKMKHTALTFVIGWLAIAGVWPLSGFWSKDEILLTAYHSHHFLIFGILAFTAFMTSFYMSRLVFLTFFGKPRNHEIHAHESPAVMTLPLWLLAIGAVFVGIPGSLWTHNWFSTFIHHAHESAEEAINWLVMGSSIAASLGGIFLAGLFYLTRLRLPEATARRFPLLYQISLNKFWIDEIYRRTIIRPFQWIGKILAEFDNDAIDGLVNDTGHAAVWTAAVQRWIDEFVVDGLVNLTGAVTQFTSALVRRLQTGFIQHYLLIMFIGALALTLWVLGMPMRPLA